MSASDTENAPPQTPSHSVGSLLSAPTQKTFIDRIPVVGFVWHLYRTYSRRNGPLLSAGIAYYALFSMGPLLLLTLQITGRLFGDPLEEAKQHLVEDLATYLGHDIAVVLVAAVTRVKGPEGYSLAIVGIGLLLYGATRLFVRLQASFNIMWDIRIVTRTFSVRRLLSRLLVLGLILIPTLLLVLGVVLGSAISWLTGLLGDSGFLIQLAEWLIPFVICWFALLVLFVVLPDVHLSWRDCWFTTMLVAIAWAVATRVFGIYLTWSGNSKYAGAIGALVGVIFWTDILAIITLVGVRFNKALYLWNGKVIRPYAYAAPVTELPDADLRGVEAASDGAAGPDETAPTDTSGTLVAPPDSAIDPSPSPGDDAASGVREADAADQTAASTGPS